MGRGEGENWASPISVLVSVVPLPQTVSSIYETSALEGDGGEKIKGDLLREKNTYYIRMDFSLVYMQRTSK